MKFAGVLDMSSGSDEESRPENPSDAVHSSSTSRKRKAVSPVRESTRLQTVAQLLHEAQTHRAMIESLQMALSTTEAENKKLKEEAKESTAKLRSAFEAGVNFFRHGFPHTDGGQDFIASARRQVVNRFLSSRQHRAMVARLILPYCRHGFEGARAQAIDMGFKAKLDIKPVLASAPVIPWEGPEEEEDFPWWEEVEERISGDFVECRVSVSDLMAATPPYTYDSLLPFPDFEVGEPSRAPGSPRGVLVDSDPESGNDAPLVRRRRCTPSTSPPPASGAA